MIPISILRIVSIAIPFVVTLWALNPKPKKGTTIETLGNSAGLLSNQGEKLYKLFFHNGSIKKKVLKYGTPKP